MPEQYLRVAEVLTWLSIPRITLYYFIKNEKFPFHKIGRQYRFLEVEVQKWIEASDIKAARKRAAQGGKR